MRIEFDPETHTYRLDGRIVPGIHQIARTVGLVRDIPPQARAAVERGALVHEAIELHLRGELDRGSCEWVLPFVDAVDAVMQREGWTCEYVEHLVADPVRAYATKIDMVARDANNRPVAVNWKTGARYPFHAVQSYAEVHAYLETVPTMYRVAHGCAVYLDEVGSPAEYHPYDLIVERVWLAACDLYDWIMFTGGGGGARSDDGATETESMILPVAGSKLFEERERNEGGSDHATGNPGDEGGGLFG